MRKQKWGRKGAFSPSLSGINPPSRWPLTDVSNCLLVCFSLKRVILMDFHRLHLCCFGYVKIFFFTNPVWSYQWYRVTCT